MQDGFDPSWGEALGLGLAPGTQVAGFTVEEKVAAGGSGTVYRASRGGQRYALKLVPLDAWGEREVDALRRVRHTRVVGFWGYGLWPEVRPRYLVLALEYVEGRVLDAWARERNPSALELVRQVLLPLARALGEVHAAGVVHRDVKEANVMVREADGQPVLVDFGAARYEGAVRLTERLPPGTQEYRSPEVLRFARTWDGGHYVGGPADDLWALGVTVYWLLTRELPFGDRRGPLVDTILKAQPEPPHARNPRVPEALGAVCLRMLEKEPRARYPDAAALEQALEQAVAQADDTWRVALFAEARQESPPGPEAVPGAQVPLLPVKAGPWWVAALEAPPGARAPAAPVQAAPPPRPPPPPAPSRRWPGLVALAGGLGLMLLGVVRLPEWSVTRGRTEGPRSELPARAPPRQAGPGQEMADAGMTAEVGSSAEPSKSPTPAPVAPATHREEPLVRNPSKTRSKTAALLLAGSACTAPGCVSAPQSQPVVEPPQPLLKCPPGADATYKRFELTNIHVVELVAGSKDDTARVRHGQEIKPRIIFGDWGLLPSETLLSGRVWFGQDRVYGRLTKVSLPGGETAPICYTFWYNGYSLPMKAGSTRTEAVVPMVTEIIVDADPMRP